MKLIFINVSRFFQLALLFICAHAGAQGLYCGTKNFENAVANSRLINPYYSPDGIVKQSDLVHMAKQLKHVDVISYAFGTIKSDRLTLSEAAKHNIQLLNQWRYSHPRVSGEPEFALVLSIGGWGGRDSFTSFLSDREKLDDFVRSATELVANEGIDGIDVDWENVSLTSQAEQKGVIQLIQELKAQLPSGACVSNAVPATSFYWKQYPGAEKWSHNVDWTVVMGYDLYGTFGSYNEIASNLRRVKRGQISKSDYHYGYPQTASVAKALKHYKKQGVPASKLIMGVPFYCHSYFTNFAKNGGLRQRVYDPNTSYQIPLNQAIGLWKSGKITHLKSDASSYSLIPIKGAVGTAKYQFLSCETPESISEKARYTKHKGLAGMSMWEFTQDVSYDNPESLLHAMVSKPKNPVKR